jgi:hypothetical protein
VTAAALAHDIAQALAAGQFDLNDEKACQAQIHDWLTDRLPGVEIQREHRLSPADIPDFLIEGVVVEIKMNSARPASILRQLERYADHSEVQALVLVTNRALFLRPTDRGKPLLVVNLGRAWL